MYTLQFLTVRPAEDQNTPAYWNKIVGQTYCGSINNFVACDSLSVLVYLVSEIIWGRSSVRNVIFYPKVSVGTAWIVTSRQKYSTNGFIFANHVRCSRSGKNGVFSDYELVNAICRANFENCLCGFWGKIAAISANHKGGAFDWDRIKDGLDKVFCIVLMTKINHSSTHERSRLPLVGRASLYTLKSEGAAIRYPKMQVLTVF